MERFTQRARRVLSLAHQEAERARQNNIGTEHLLLGLMDEEGGVAGRVLRYLRLENVEKDDRVLFKDVIQRAKEYFADKDRFERDTKDAINGNS